MDFKTLMFNLNLVFFQAEDFLISQEKRVRLRPHDKLLRKFRFGDALSAALKEQNAQVRISLFSE